MSNNERRINSSSIYYGHERGINMSRGMGRMNFSDEDAK